MRYEDCEKSHLQASCTLQNMIPIRDALKIADDIEEVSTSLRTFHPTEATGINLLERDLTMSTSLDRFKVTM